MEGNKVKSNQLGMSFGKANAILRRRIMFMLLVNHNENYCYRCNGIIQTDEELSIDHKIPWLHSNPSLFWELSNISFSHKRCNYAAGKKVGGGILKIISPDGYSWCSICKRHRLKECFSKDSGKGGRSGINKECKKCRNSRRP